MSDIDPVKILETNKIFVNKLKKENKKLERKIKILLKNNKALTELVKVLEDKILSLTPIIDKKRVYDYEKGGWTIDGSLNKNIMELKEDKLDIGKINLQLAEIIRLMEKHKVKHLKREQEINNKVLGVEKIGVKKEKKN